MCGDCIYGVWQKLFCKGKPPAKKIIRRDVELTRAKGQKPVRRRRQVISSPKRTAPPPPVTSKKENKSSYKTVQHYEKADGAKQNVEYVVQGPEPSQQERNGPFAYPTWDDKPEPERCSTRDPSSQSSWSAKPVASVSPLPVTDIAVTSSEERSVNPVSVSPAPHSHAPPEGFEWAVALYDFEAQRGDELGFAAGEKLLVECRFDHDWLYGCTVKDSRCGLFPAAFVQLENDSETESLKETDSINSKAAELISPPAVEVSSGSISVTGRPAVALYTFMAEQEGDLGFEEGETVYVLSRINKDWLQGRNKRGKEGQFPASFVQPERESSATTMEISGIDGHNKSTPAKDAGVYVCLYDFEAQQDDDLTIHFGDKIQVTKMVSEEWWQGRILGNQQEGIFPATFVKPL